MHNQARLKIWVGEYISAGGMASVALPQSLLREGQLMRDALVADCQRAGFDCITACDARVRPPTEVPYDTVHAQVEAWRVWQQQWADAQVDAVWLIAPETDGLLATACSQVIAQGLLWLGCELSAITCCSSKARMADYFTAYQIMCIPHVLLQAVLPEMMQSDAALLQAIVARLSAPLPADAVGGWVVKPDDGAGCTDTYVTDSVALPALLRRLYAQSPKIPWLIQPYIDGVPLSMSVVASRHAVQVVAANTQWLQHQGNQLHYMGAGIHHAVNHLASMQAFAARIHAAMPGLLGFWGADLIMTNHGHLYLVEINPRLTTPYIGLAPLMATNPAQMVISAIRENVLPQVSAQGSASLRLDSTTSQPAFAVCL